MDSIIVFSVQDDGHLIFINDCASPPEGTRC